MPVNYVPQTHPKQLSSFPPSSPPGLSQYLLTLTALTATWLSSRLAFSFFSHLSIQIDLLNCQCSSLLPSPPQFHHVTQGCILGPSFSVALLCSMRDPSSGIKPTTVDTHSLNHGPSGKSRGPFFFFLPHSPQVPSPALFPP